MCKKFTVLLAVLAIAGRGTGQESAIYTHQERNYKEALRLYNEKQYQAAQTLFEEVKAQTTDPQTEASSAYYIANAAVRLNQVGADRLMEAFVAQYPTSVHRNSAYMDVADYYFENGRYPYAIKWYRRVDLASLSRQERERFDFQMGYSLFSSKKPEEAERYLQRVSNSDTYGSQAKYYLGYIAYQQDDYQQANERFDQITDQELLEEKLSYYQADMNFKLGNFETAIEQAVKQLSKSDRRERSELNKIIGESYFNLGRYQEAIPYLESYKGKRGKWTNTDYYLLGYAHYKQGDFAAAIQQFNKIIDAEDDVAQNAYYHLAECYLELDKKQEALNAFRNASRMQYNPEIRQDAYLNYARLSYEIGNPYEPVPTVLKGFIERYPDAPQRTDIQELLVDSYITSRNFKGAVELLEANRNYASPETYQKVTFFRGVELFLEEAYSEARKLFETSADTGADPLYSARALFWEAEAAFAMGDFQEALEGYRAFGRHPRAGSVSEYENLEYQMGYAYFKLKEYAAAAERFRAFISNGDSGPRRTDAQMRLGDSYFVTSRYREAISAYEQAVASGSTAPDYAAYQKALSFGFLGQEQTKRRELDAFLNRFPGSTLRDDVLFELGNSYANAGEDAAAIGAYDRLLDEYAMSSLVPAAMMRKGLVYYNGGQNEQALEVFRRVAAEYPSTQQARQAVQTAKLIYVDMGKVDAYASWARSLDFVEVTDSELEAATFEAAEKQRLTDNTEGARRAYEKYLEQFPGGTRRLQAHFELAQIHFAAGRSEEALPHYQAVADSGTGEQREQALTRVCEILVSKPDYPAAMPYLQQLEASADIAQNRTFAQSNLMKGYFRAQQYDRTLEYADKVLSNPSLDDRIRSDARLMIARAAWETGDFEKSQEAYARVLEIASGKTAAEALYYQALFAHRQGDFEASNASVERLARDYAPYKEWGAKGLVLMAKNFDRLEDAFQATYILENVIANFGEYPELVAEAETVLAQIRAAEAERNASVNPQGNK